MKTNHTLRLSIVFVIVILIVCYIQLENYKLKLNYVKEINKLKKDESLSIVYVADDLPLKFGPQLMLVF